MAKAARTVDQVQDMIDKLPDSGKVTVACKLPSGLELRLFNMEDVAEPVFGGGTKQVKQARLKQGSPIIRIFGNSVPFGQAPRCQIVGGFALTPNVDAAFMKEWLTKNKDLDAVKNGLVYAYASAASAVDVARERKELRSGFEPLVPDTDPRVPKSTNKALSDIKTAEEQVMPVIPETPEVV